jgi:hypothetical protein
MKKKAQIVAKRAIQKSKAAAKSKSKKPRKGSAARTKKNADANQDVCFVIMPFGGWGDDYFEEIYKPAVDSSNLEVHRADDLFRPSTIVHDIWAYTKRAKLLLADLTGRNPNVFYELGLAHALGKPAILIAESMEEVPFDLRALRVIIYDKNAPDWGTILRENIESSIREVLESPVAAVLPTFLESGGGAPKPVVSERDLQFVEMKQEIELLRHELRANLELGSSPKRRRRREIDPDEARDLILHYLKAGMTRGEIIQRVEPLGPPDNWINRAIDEFNLEGIGTRASRPVAKPARLVASARPPRPAVAAKPRQSNAVAAAPQVGPISGAKPKIS